MTDRPGSSEAGTFFIAAVGLSVASWPFSFTLGAYGEVFYQDVMTIWVASVAALIAAAVIGRTEQGEVYFNWWGAIVLLIPSMLMFAEVAGVAGNSTFVSVLEWLLLLAALPYVGFILLSVAAPDTMELHNPRLIFGLAGCLVVINTASFGIGYFNAYFFNCDDFIRAGDEAPSGCWKA